MPAANNLPISRTLSEILDDWKVKKFTGIAIVNVHLGVAKSIEYGRPDRIQIDHDENTLIKNSLTSPSSPP